MIRAWGKGEGGPRIDKRQTRLPKRVIALLLVLFCRDADEMQGNLVPLSTHARAHASSYAPCHQLRTRDGMLRTLVAMADLYAV